MSGDLATMREAPSLPLAELYPMLDGSGLEYDLRPYTAKNRFTLLSGPPKVGKSTFTTLYAHAKASAGEFLGQRLTIGSVLYVAPDENWRDVVRRFRGFGTPPDLVNVWTSRSRSIGDIAHRAREIEANLVVLDTLLRVAGIADENDNAIWDRWFDEALSYVQDSGVIWLAVHHDRKSGGAEGEGIRGASNIFGSVDVAVSLQSTDDGGRRRVLRGEGAKLDQPDDLVIELDPDESTYRAVGEPRVVSILEDAALERLRGVLDRDPQVVKTILAKLQSDHPETEGDVSPSAVRKRLEKLRTAGLATRHGEGGRRDPYRYSLTRSQGPGETSEGEGETLDAQGDGRSPDSNGMVRPKTHSLPHDPLGSEEVSVSEADPEDPLEGSLDAALGGRGEASE